MKHRKPPSLLALKQQLCLLLLPFRRRPALFHQWHMKYGEFKHSFGFLLRKYLRDCNPKAIVGGGPRCHLSSLRLQEIDVLHFATNNIGRGNQSTPHEAPVSLY